MRDIRYEVQPDQYYLKAVDFNIFENPKVQGENFINIDYRDIELKSYFKLLGSEQVQVIFILDISNSLYEYKAEYLAVFNTLEKMDKEELKRKLSSIVFFFMYKNSRDLAEKTLTEAFQRKVILPVFDRKKLKDKDAE